MTGERGLEFELEAYKKAIELGAPVRIRLYVLWSKVFGPKGIGARTVEEINRSLDPSRLRIAGVKIFADGAISSGTAAIYGRFGADPSAENEPTNEGVLMYPPERLHAMIRQAHEAGLPLAIHSIGDRSTDLVMDAFEQLGDASAHRIEHAMMLSDLQIERLARIGCRVTMQPEFLVRIGHAYQRQLGPERTSRLKRCRSVVDADLRLSLNSDRPVVPGDPWVGVYAASQRPEGFDPAENLSLEESIAAYTAAGAGSVWRRWATGSGSASRPVGRDAGVRSASRAGVRTASRPTIEGPCSYWLGA
ncbi:MAG: putative metal-dependent hydrolase with the TIM-barrel fold protein [Armatimonadetes bacterium OLB18]|nr:MAG: putative metal-dependent hydrolase with the TIM-barrel fold protein [Armatimonadetes bacterium OLB18]